MLEIWWPDMLALMKTYHLKYTGAFIETYNSNVEGPFLNNNETKHSTKRLVNELLKNGGEISFHGYNHQSLLYKQEWSSIYGYSSWPSEEKIVEALSTSVDFFNQFFPEYKFYNYVPPSNLLDNDAIVALIKGVPTLKSISGVYLGGYDDDGTPNPIDFDQEFGIDERYGVALPRVTSGAFLDDNVLYDLASVVTVNGIVNHFIHPDDVIDSERGRGLMWEELYKAYDFLFGTVDEKYPWLETQTASNAAEKVREYTGVEVYTGRSDKTITIAVRAISFART